MSLLLTAALVASAASLPTCSWDHPGAGPYMGTVASAVDRYTDIPQPVREALKARMVKHQYDEMAAIRRDSITGKSRYAPELRQMHFGEGQVCGTVTRSRWSENAVERGLVYCESGHCLIVPTVCRNVSRVTRLGPDEASPALKEAKQADKDEAPGSTVTAGGEPGNELLFDAPGAGPSFADPSGAASPLGGSALAYGGGLGGIGGTLPGLGAGPGSGGGAGGGTGGGTGGGPSGIDSPPGTVPSSPLANNPEAPREGGGPPLPLDPPGIGIGGGGTGVTPEPLSPVPEPRSAALALAGLLGLLAAVRHRRRGAGHDRVS